MWIWAGYASAALNLSPADRQWLAQHPVVRYAPEADYGPFVFEPEGQAPQGMSVDFLALIGKEAGIQFVPTPAAPLSHNLDLAKAHEVDVITSLRPTPERAQYLGFTSPYVSIPATAVARSGDAASTDLRQLAGHTVAVGKGYGVEAFVREHYPAVHWLAVPDDLAGLTALRQRKVDAAVMDEASYAFLIKQQGWQDVQLGERVGFNYPLSMAYRADWPELGRIMEAALRDIPSDQKSALMSKWLSTTPKRGWLVGHRPLLFAGVLLLIGALALAIARRKSAPAPANT